MYRILWLCDEVNMRNVRQVGGKRYQRVMMRVTKRQSHSHYRKCDWKYLIKRLRLAWSRLIMSGCFIIPKFPLLVFFWPWHRILVAILRTRWEWVLPNMLTMIFFDGDQSIILGWQRKWKFISQPVSNSENSINRASNTMSVTTEFHCTTVLVCVLKKKALNFSGVWKWGWNAHRITRMTIVLD